MARKKKKFTLEQEFEKVKEYHKTGVIYEALIGYPELYKNRLLKFYANLNPNDIELKELEDSNEELEDRTKKAYIVELHLISRERNGEKGIYNKVYELCWKKIRKLIDDTQTVDLPQSL